MAMEETTFPERAEPTRTLLHTRAEYLAAVDALLPLARARICVFDPDLVMAPLDTPARIAQLQRFLRTGSEQRLQIAVHDPTHVASHAPRLRKLLQEFPAAIAIHRTEGEARRAQDAFLLIDDMHFVRRPVAQQSRGVYTLHEPREGRQLAERFAEIWQNSEQAVSPTTLGL